MHDAGQCANCGRAIDGGAQKFCPGCGQPTPMRRIDWAFMREQFRHDVLNMDRGLLYTLKRLMREPGVLLRDYLEGRREGIVKPLLLLSVMAALVIVLTTYAGGTTPMGASGDGDVGRSLVNAWVDRHLALFTVLLLPVEALMFQLAFQRLRAVNYPEWLAILAFLTAQGWVLWSLVALVQRWLPPLVAESIVAFGAMAYAIFSLMQFFPDVSRWNILLRGLLAHLLFIISQFLVMRTAELALAALLG